MGDIILVEGENELNVQMVPVAVNVQVAYFLRVVNNSLLADLNSMNRDTSLQVTQLGVTLNNKGSYVDDLSIIAANTGGYYGTVNLAPPMDKYLNLLSEPFSMEPGEKKDIFWVYTFQWAYITVDTPYVMDVTLKRSGLPILLDELHYLVLASPALPEIPNLP